MVIKMARDKKLYTLKASKGIGKNKENEASFIKNMISNDGRSVKRHGHKNVLKITDKDLNGLPINGIFDYSYKENEEIVSKKVVHAGDKLFLVDDSFNSFVEIEIPKEIILKNERTQAFSRGEILWIVGASGVLLYDGKTLKSAYEHPNAYIPKTKENGKESDSPNLLTRKRINTFVGTKGFREVSKANMFLLDEKIKDESNLVIEVKIRTRTSEEEPSDEVSQYIGIDSRGSEVGKPVIIRYAHQYSSGTHYFLSEPIRDEAGNIINLKIDDKVLTYDKLPFGMTVKNGKEISLSFDLPSPIKGESNVIIKYEADTKSEADVLKNAEIVALANGEKGGEIMLLNLGDNKIYFTDEKEGLFYLPEKNKICLGSDGEKITSIVKLSDNLVGVFKKNSFSRIKFVSSNNDGYEIISSTDLEGSYSQFSTSLVDYDCLVFNESGIYGVSEYKSTANVFNCLRPRASKINHLLSLHLENDRENAQSISYKSKYYLFIGDMAYVADTSQKYKESGKEGDAYEYEWWVWDNCGARILYSDGKDLYFGTENGQIRKFYDGFSDTEIREYSNEEISLLLNNEGEGTKFIIPKIDEINFDIAKAHLSNHERLIACGAIYKNGLLYLENDEMFFGDGSVKLYENDTLALYDKAGELVIKSEILDVDLIFKSIELKENDGLREGVLYDVYLCLENGFNYELSKDEDGVFLLWNNKKIKMNYRNVTLTIIEEAPIECVYKTAPISFDTINQKTLYNLFLKLTEETRGEVEIHLETEKSTLEKKLFIGEPISFDSLSLSDTSFKAPFKSTQLLGSFLRNFESLRVEIKSKGTQDFGLEEISFLYLKSPKTRRIQ